VLEEITNNVSLQNVDELLRQAEQMLTEIRRRDFSEKTHEVQEELARAIEGLYTVDIYDLYTVRHNYQTLSFKQQNLVNIQLIYMKISGNIAEGMPSLKI